MTSLFSKIGINVGGKVQATNSSNNQSGNAINKKDPVIAQTLSSTSAASEISTKQTVDVDMDQVLTNSVQVKPIKTSNGMMSPRKQPAVAPIIDSPKSDTGTHETE